MLRGFKWVTGPLFFRGGVAALGCDAMSGIHWRMPPTGGWSACGALYNLVVSRCTICASLKADIAVPLNEIPKYLSPDTRRLVDAALEEAWQELNKDSVLDAHRARMKLATTIVALACVGETDPAKLKRFAVHAIQGVLRRTTNLQCD
jgi:hypothetical protein